MHIHVNPQVYSFRRRRTLYLLTSIFHHLSLPSGGVVLLSLAFLMPAFYYIPKASLAAVIICAVAPMVDYRLVAEMWRVRSE